MTQTSAQPQVARELPNRNLGVAYALWFFLGVFGGHRFYLRRGGSGVLYLFTGGLLLVGWIFDGFHLPRMVHKLNSRGY